VAVVGGGDGGAGALLAGGDVDFDAETVGLGDLLAGRGGLLGGMELVGSELVRCGVGEGFFGAGVRVVAGAAPSGLPAASVVVGVCSIGVLAEAADADCSLTCAETPA